MIASGRWAGPLPALCLVLGGSLLGCEDDVGAEETTDYRLRDVMPTLGDAARDDVGPSDGAVVRLDRAVEGDGGARDGGRLDLALALDMARADGARPLDMARPLDTAPLPEDTAPLPEDMAPLPVDMAPPPPDMGRDIPPGREPCQQGPGWSLIRISYDDRSDSPRTDLWDVPCDYSIRINDGCGVFDRAQGAIGNEVGRTDTGAVALDGSDDLLIWFDTPPEDVQAAVFYVLGRSLCAASSTEFDLSSPTDGYSLSGGPVGQQFEYQWHFAALPAFRGDDLALILTAGRGCGRLGVQAFEICVP